MAWPTTSRQSRGYGRAHERMREHLLSTVIHCEECERRGLYRPGVIADHIIPKAKGGGDERGNYQLLCRPCSDAKTLADKGMEQATHGVDRSGRPTDPAHPWNRRA